jgi:DNA-directed RNA polymerase specialized sigma24 family protein
MLYHELIRPYERSVYLMALSYLKNEADAEDVAQEAFVKALSESLIVSRGGEVQHMAYQHYHK